MDLETNNEPISIAYYPFRAKAQVCRLLCEFLHLPYRDRFFNPDEWAKFRDNQAKDWIVRDLPFLQDGDFVTVGPLAMSTYIVEKANRTDLYGKTIQDKALIDSIRSRTDISLTMLAAKCSTRPTCELQNKKCMEYYWENKIKPVLAIYEKQCKLDPWFLNYISILDFVVYEIINLLSYLFPDEISKLKKLQTLREKVKKIPEIEQYQKSDAAVSQFCPMRYFNNFREAKLKGSRSSSSASSTGSCSSKRNMDLE